MRQADALGGQKKAVQLHVRELSVHRQCALSVHCPYTVSGVGWEFPQPLVLASPLKKALSVFYKKGPRSSRLPPRDGGVTLAPGE